MNFFIRNQLQTDACVAFVNSLSIVPPTSSLSTAAAHSLSQQNFWPILEDWRSRGSRGYLLYRIPEWQFLIIFKSDQKLLSSRMSRYKLAVQASSLSAATWQRLLQQGFWLYIFVLYRISGWQFLIIFCCTELLLPRKPEFHRTLFPIEQAVKSV